MNLVKSLLILESTVAPLINILIRNNIHLFDTISYQQRKRFCNEWELLI